MADKIHTITPESSPFMEQAVFGPRPDWIDGEICKPMTTEYTMIWKGHKSEEQVQKNTEEFREMLRRENG